MRRHGSWEGKQDDALSSKVTDSNLQGGYLGLAMAI